MVQAFAAFVAGNTLHDTREDKHRIRCANFEIKCCGKAVVLGSCNTTTIRCRAATAWVRFSIDVDLMFVRFSVDFR